MKAPLTVPKRKRPAVTSAIPASGPAVAPGLSIAHIKGSVNVAAPTPDTLTVAIPKSRGTGSPNTVDVSPVSEIVTSALVKGKAPSAPVPVTVSVYVIGVAWARWATLKSPIAK